MGSKIYCTLWKREAVTPNVVLGFYGLFRGVHLGMVHWCLATNGCHGAVRAVQQPPHGPGLGGLLGPKGRRTSGSRPPVPLWSPAAGSFGARGLSCRSRRRGQRHLRNAEEERKEDPMRTQAE